MWRCCFLLLLAWSPALNAQVKYEREYRLRPEAIPPPALRFVDSCDFERKVRWYGEESSRGPSVEAKVKQQGRWFSIEFDTLGGVEDVEVEVGWEALPRSARDEICEYLAQNFDRFRIQRVQQQWTAREDRTLIELIRQDGDTVAGPHTRKYELIVRGTAERETNGYELLFSDAGELERSARIVYRNTDNLDY